MLVLPNYKLSRKEFLKMELFLSVVVAVSTVASAALLFLQNMYKSELHITYYVHSREKDVVIIVLEIYPSERPVKISKIKAKNAYIREPGTNFDRSGNWFYDEKFPPVSSEIDVDLVIPPSRNSSHPEVLWLAIKPLNSQSSFLISLITPTMLLPIKHKINVLTNSDR